MYVLKIAAHLLIIAYYDSHFKYFTLNPISHCLLYSIMIFTASYTVSPFTCTVKSSARYVTISFVYTYVLL